MKISKKHILLWYRNQDRAKSLIKVLSLASKEWNLHLVSTENDLQTHLRNGPLDLILLQEKGFSETEGNFLLNEIRERMGDVPIIFLSEKPDLDSVLKAFHLGVFDYLREPFSDEEVIAVVRLALEKRDLQNEKEKLLQDLMEANQRIFPMEREGIQKELSILSTLDVNPLLSKCLNLAMDFFEAKKGVALAFDRNNQILIVRETTGFNGHLTEGTSFDIRRNPELKRVVSEGKPSFLPSIEGRIVCAPLGVPPDVLGVIGLGRSTPFTDSDLKVLSVFAPFIPYALEGNRIQSELEATRTGSILSLLFLLEEKDPSLWQHTTRVMEISNNLARTIIGLSDKTLQSIKFAALLHDVGKLAEESTLEEKILRMTTRVIEPLRLPEETMEILTHQGEHYDGKGDPHALRGDEIPIGSRIIAIADAYDEGMKEGKTEEEVLRILSHHSGTRFDPLIVEQLTQLLQTPHESRFSSPFLDGSREPLQPHL